jgi:hypothetical protein
MLSFVSVIVLLFILVLIGLVANVGYVINRKMEVQNSADAVAYSSAIWMARGMNVITATNHLVGEMQALVVLHAAIGGEELENKPPLDPSEALAAKARLDAATTELDEAWLAAHAVGAETIAYPQQYEKVGERVTSGATYRAALTDLKKALAKVYFAKAAAAVLEKSAFPPTVAIGAAVDVAATGVEVMILAEYTTLKAMETFAKSPAVLGFRNLLSNQLLPGASAFERLAVEAVPHAAAGVARAIAERNETSGGIYPAAPPLPVLREHPSNADLPTSALVRTTFPWVAYDRTPVLRMTKWMIFSHTRDHYLDYTNRYTLLKSKELVGHGFAMYVMTRPGESKGHEPWTSDSRLADRKFTVVGFAHRPAKTLMSSSVFGTPNSDGIVACAQAIVYNANRQNPGNGPPTFQPEVGWDTLNWQPPVMSSGAYEFAKTEESTTCPRYLVNWQAKLVPVSRLGEAARSGEVSGPFQVLQRLGSGSKQLLTH